MYFESIPSIHITPISHWEQLVRIKICSATVFPKCTTACVDCGPGPDVSWEECVLNSLQYVVGEQLVQQRERSSRGRQSATHDGCPIILLLIPVLAIPSPLPPFLKIFELVIKGHEKIETSQLPPITEYYSLSSLLHLLAFSTILIFPPLRSPCFHSLGNNQRETSLFTANLVPSFPTLILPSVSFPLIKHHHFSPFPSFPDSPLPLSHSSSSSSSTGSASKPNSVKCISTLFKASPLCVEILHTVQSISHGQSCNWQLHLSQEPSNNQNRNTTWSFYIFALVWLLVSLLCPIYNCKFAKLQSHLHVVAEHINFHIWHLEDKLNQVTGTFACYRNGI